ncbi:MAG TPA: RluA family pseudouridine synthase, partial [Candidatus Xenobia bacterium]
LTISFEKQGSSPGEGLRIVHQDDDIIVVEKPAGLLTIATAAEKTLTAYALLNDWLRTGRVWVVHRLDRGTSGLLVFARSESVKRSLQGEWSQVDKRYVAVVHGRLSEAQGTIRSYLRETATLQVVSTPGPCADAREAITHYQVRSASDLYSMVDVRLETGRKHQIRVHLALQGHPVVGDKRYGSTADPIQRLALHAAELSLPHPRTGRKMSFSSPLPATFASLLPG